MFDPVDNGTSCMTLAVMTCPAFTFREFKEEFRATGRMVPAGIVLSANNSAANMIRQIHHMRFMEITFQIMSSSASYRIYDGSTSKPHAVKRSMGTYFCPRLVRTHSLSSSELSYCAGERPICSTNSSNDAARRRGAGTMPLEPQLRWTNLFLLKSISSPVTCSRVGSIGA